jgi:tRNA A-37 threonylcarbamoyl transferase component Bud32
LRSSLFWLAKHFKALSFLEIRSAMPPQQRFDLELQHLREFSDLGLPVPQLVEATNDYFITKAAGQQLTRPQPFPNKALLTQAFDLLGQFHQADVIHGRPAMRDILVNEEGKLTYIDLEEARHTQSQTLKSRDATLLLVDSYCLRAVSQQTRVQLVRYWIAQAHSQDCQYWEKLLGWYRYLHWLPRLILRFKNNSLSKQIILTARVIEQALKLEEIASKENLDGSQKADRPVFTDKEDQHTKQHHQ